MKNDLRLLAALCIGLMTATVAFGAEAEKGAAAADAPAAVLVEDRFVFPKVVDGTEVTHDFILRNQGGATLDVQKVKTG